jgi:ParB family chromosome partitioning protein
MLCKRLTAHRTAAVQIELAQQPTVALAVLMYRMIPAVFRDLCERTRYDHAVEIEVQTTRDALLSNADDMAESAAWKALENGKRGIRHTLTAGPKLCARSFRAMAA